MDEIQDNLAREAIELYAETVRLFDTPIEFTAEEKIRDGKRIVNVYARGDAPANGKRISPRELYKNLDKGFNRKVRMTWDFKAKTTPKSLMTTSGSGGVMYAKGKPVFMPPEPVIPREFTSVIAEIIRDRLKERLRSVRGGKQRSN